MAAMVGLPGSRVLQICSGAERDAAAAGHDEHAGARVEGKRLDAVTEAHGGLPVHAVADLGAVDSEDAYCPSILDQHLVSPEGLSQMSFVFSGRESRSSPTAAALAAPETARIRIKPNPARTIPASSMASSTSTVAPGQPSTVIA